MAGPTINDFLPAEMRKFAEQSVEQAKRAFEELAAATQRTIAAFEGQSSSAQANAREIQRKVIAYSERNIAASLEFAQNLLSAKSPESVMALHAQYVKAQMAALTEQARDIAEHATTGAVPNSPSKGSAG